MWIGTVSSVVIVASLLCAVNAASLNIFGGNPAGLFEGDLRLSTKQRKVVDDAVKNNRTISEEEIHAFGASSTAFQRWTNAIVPYTIHGSLSFNSAAVYAIKQGIAEWEAKTCIRFRQRGTERNYLEFFRNNGCWGQVGMQRGKSQISVGTGCEHRHVMTHEIGHALGFWHEQSRTDRDQYIQILWQNVPRSLYEAFAKYGNDKVDSLGVPYDYASIMHYPWNAFSTNGRNTVRPLRHVPRQPYKTLSDLDAKQANIMYKCAGTVTPTRAPTKGVTTPCRPLMASCSDMRRECKGWAQRGECSRNSGYMLVYCKASCGRCPVSTCVDDDARCPGWAASGECRKNPAYMLVKCKKSCLVCSIVSKCKTNPPVTAPPTQPLPPPTDKIVPTTTAKKIPTTAAKKVPTTGASQPTPTPPLVVKVSSTTHKKLVTNAPPLPPISAAPSTTAKPASKKPTTGSGCSSPEPAGMESRVIPDSQITASSAYNKWHAPSEARLNQVAGVTGVGAWCAAKNEIAQYIQVDLGKTKKLLEVVTQGRPGLYPKYVKSYFVSTSFDGKIFTMYKAYTTDANPMEFIANSDDSTAVSNSLHVIVQARYVRIHPNAWHSAICLRMELYVC